MPVAVSSVEFCSFEFTNNIGFCLDLLAKYRTAGFDFSFR